MKNSVLFWSSRFYASLDKSVQQEMLLYSWKQYHASLDESTQQEMLLCGWKQFYASLDKSVQQEMLLSIKHQRVSLFNNWMVTRFWGLGASGVQGMGPILG